MLRLSFALGCLLASIASLSTAAPRPFSLDDLARIRGVSNPQLSPDGRRVAYTVRTVNVGEDRNETHIWTTGWDGRDTVRLTTGPKSETEPRWSPDGRFLSFLSSRGDANDASQLWLLPTGGGEAEKITDLPGGVEDYDWAPDSRRLVLVARDPEPGTE